ncbi:serine/threonine protein kinase and signal transduction histidine kinase with GAF and PAS/PAC sensor (plasmid) [Scytonema sp. HK-05]|uniref:AAA family ATPase n=1 Tax=Scytonema sp. HK-05 TaxID=1137095 RepID=UPI00093606B8|nr:AAA family ATPase [Scytonema sp. HK-05]OKH57063.1 serine/threonine protein kinase [Scytonema sp. HK-05]BAY50248.1 serine/threonine protein kinase and signal transduction histidine kinase with GAF and PAS/PAC sensor [Scytonema sp. HK-05]
MIALAGVAIQSKIYESSASLVYRGIKVRDNQAIIVKLLKQDYPSPQEITRYRQEYEMTRSLKEEGVVKAYSQQDYQRTLVILLEDFGGESLEKWMHKRPDFCPMPLSNFLRLAINLTDILGRIHAANVIHKDINPGNIVLNPDTGVVKIIDFGIATQFNRTNPTFKSPHVLEGTVAYVSPEQTGRMNRLLDYRTDFYSLGVTFYELLTGQLPFPTTDILELVHCHIAKSPVPVHQVNATIPKPVSDIVLKLMAKNAEDRYQSAWGIKADLERCAEQFTTTGQIAHIQLGLQDVCDQFQIPQKLYGREAEITALLAAFERVAPRGNVGEAHRPESGIENAQFNVEMMLVSGYSGVGKSALVQELYKPITAKRGYFVSGKFDQLGRNIPYSAIVDALQKLVQQLLSEPDEQVHQWRSRLLTALESNGQLIIDVIPEVELIVGKQPPVPKVGPMEAQNRFNLVFQKFIRACCSPEHPLVIFLDDLQWVDSATLKLIELIVSDRVIQSLLLIGAYRDNEVTQAHPLITILEKLKQETVAINQITLAPLKLGAVAQLIAETLHSSTELVAPLAELVWRKTNGNPYFTSEFLKTLYTEDLIIFNNKQRCWQWDVAYIKAKNITDNVVELIIGKLKQLPEHTQQVLSLAACVGPEFDLATLAVICEQPAIEIFAELTTAIQSELILATLELDENLLIQNYKFSHDRVQQAAYGLIAEEQQQVVHLQIGYLLLQSSESETTPHNLFEVVDHLNLGRHLVTDWQERDKLARLNLLAGHRAKKTLAHSAALQYLTTGIELLAADSWQLQYALTLALHEEAAEAAYLSADFQQMEQWAIVVLENANTVLDKIKVYETKIQTCVAQGRQKEAIRIGLEVLKFLGIALPESPTQVDVQKRLKETADYFNSIDIKDLLELPLMREPDKLAAIQILSNLVGPTFQAAPTLLPLIVLGQINLSVQYGNTSFSTFAYAAYGGLILSGVMQDFESAHQFGELALSLTERLDSKELRCKVLDIVGAFIIHCKDHIRRTLPLLQEAYEIGLETGDLEFSGYSVGFKCVYLHFAGLELTKIESEIKIYKEILAQLKQQNSLNYLYRLQQFICNLTEQVENPACLVGSYYNEEQFLPIYIRANDRPHLYYVYLYKLILSYLFEDSSQAVEYASQSELYLDGVPGTFSIPVFYFYDSLVQIRLYQSVSSSEQEHLLLKIISNQEKMQRWAHSAPTNFQHKYDLVEAEKARVLGQFFEAENLYEQAILGARDNEYLQEEALAYELAAKHYLARGREKFAQLYMKEAHYCYERWGATAKVRDLETRYPQLFPQSSNVVSTPVCTTTGTTSNTSHSTLDLATVMKAAQAISSEIELERLLSSLMQILIENAGAQTGCLLLENSGEWAIEAACELHEGDPVCATRVLQSAPITNRLPESIIQYVIRTHESVILNNAAREGSFINDPYIQHHQTKSIFCLPLLNQAKLVGVLYLENQLATFAFTPERNSFGDATRSQVLHLLSTQAAIAIENATLYSKLRASKSQMAQFLEAVPVGIAVFDAVGRPYYFNQRAVQLVGKESDPSVSLDQLVEAYQVYLAGTDQPYPTEALPSIRALSGERSTVDNMEIHQNDKTIPVEVWGTPVFDEQGKVVYAIAAFQDITERKQAEQLLAHYNRTLEQQVIERTAALQKSEAALRYREQQLRLITDALPVCISYVDANQHYQFVNQTYEDWFCCSRDKILGKHTREILGEAAYQVAQPYINRALSGQITIYESEIPYPFGKRYIRGSLIPDFDLNHQVRGYYGLITDITEQRNAVLRERQQAEEASILNERNRMAREIHDTLAQAFTGILLHVGAATQVLTDDKDATQAHLEMLDELARSGLAEARRSVAALRPQFLEDGSLHSALHRLVTQMRAATDTGVSYEIKGTAYPLPNEVENNLLRIGQEALTNAIKYADASEIRIDLLYENTQCILRVKDDGRGFGVDSIPRVRGFGLLGISERCEKIGAQVTITSQPGQGTEIVITINRD